MGVWILLINQSPFMGVTFVLLSHKSTATLNTRGLGGGCYYLMSRNQAPWAGKRRGDGCRCEADIP